MWIWIGTAGVAQRLSRHAEGPWFGPRVLKQEQTYVNFINALCTRPYEIGALYPRFTYYNNNGNNETEAVNAHTASEWSPPSFVKPTFLPSPGSPSTGTCLQPTKSCWLFRLFSAHQGEFLRFPSTKKGHCQSWQQQLTKQLLRPPLVHPHANSTHYSTLGAFKSPGVGALSGGIWKINKAKSPWQGSQF